MGVCLQAMRFPRVACLVFLIAFPGSYSVEFTKRDSSLPSGTYCCRLIAGNASDVTRMILLR